MLGEETEQRGKRNYREIRRDTMESIRKDVAENRRAYVLVNNRSEENAPLTIQAINDQLRE